jgi:Ser-tRNA(Ala) deacylase AlaX
MSILNSRMDGTLIYYTLPDNHGLVPGDTVEMKINWSRRYALMRLHFAAELILEIVTQKYQLEKVGAHIAEHKARIDFKAEQNLTQYFDDILASYNSIIVADKIIEKGWLDVATQRRFWKIEDFAQVPCGGTHVKSTAEVGYVTLKRDRPGKGVERIIITLADSIKS